MTRTLRQSKRKTEVSTSQGIFECSMRCSSACFSVVFSFSLLAYSTNIHMYIGVQLVYVITLLLLSSSFYYYDHHSFVEGNIFDVHAFSPNRVGYIGGIFDWVDPYFIELTCIIVSICMGERGNPEKRMDEKTWDWFLALMLIQQPCAQLISLWRMQPFVSV